MHSASQFATNDVGQTMTTFFTVGFWSSSMLVFNKVHIKAIACSVFPKPISSAKIQPAPSNPRKPITHSYKNDTPSRWCGRNHLVNMLSTFTAGNELFASSLSLSSSCHNTNSSTPSGSTISSASASDGMILGNSTLSFDPNGMNIFRARIALCNPAVWQKKKTFSK